MDSGMFFSGGSPYSPRTIFFSALQIRKMLNKTREVFIGMFSSSDLNQTKTTGHFGCFGLELKQKLSDFTGVDDLPFQKQ
jgi:hypothetical protein